MNIYSDISYIKGVGPKIKMELNKCGIFSILDLLLYFPRDYENIPRMDNIAKANRGNKIIINCRFIKNEGSFRSKNGKLISKLMFTDGFNLFKGIWFNMPYISKGFYVDNKYTLMGKLNYIKGETVLEVPIVIKEQNSGTDKIVPIYSLKENLKNSYFTKIISQVLSKVIIEENLPDWIIEKYKFYSLDRAIRCIHNPKNFIELNEAKKRLKFQELFTYSLKVLMLKDYVNRGKKGIAFKISKELTELKEKIPYDLTKAQSKVIREILIDEKKSIAMNRLLQGDVGSGKTIIALIAMFNVIKNGYQAVLLAPTEILSRQHYIEAEKLLSEFNINIELLIGSISEKNKNRIKNELKEGKIHMIIGTHALLEDNVEFSNLGLVVTDEQHRFGVMQRSKLFNKGNNIDILVMTATPIPRTLGLYLYGDLDVSIIDELPPGRKKVDTYYVDKKDRERIYTFALKELEKSRQIYVVCPLVEENEELNLSSVNSLLSELREKYFKSFTVEMIHGKMTGKNKDNIMSRFKKGEIHILVSTTVIEVGVNVPNASIIIIENAERFGLSQLHQLRGRVGRGANKSYCFLIANIKSKVVKHRMEVLKNSNDGFYIAEEDFKIRGSGELFGFRQHGEDNLILSDLIEDSHILKEANREAKMLIKSNRERDIFIKNHILNKLELTSKYICFN
ncbi:ATP-dependent DNA helicase RecG [Clostridium pasteurianum DSM 525 = ATCC 6013]|uniref:ATP-dependent DNA helicase RecG n=1 Tax=Clostridium pasteurianum DSM 525 = ATCC 6013 TaxID=1262449 RepID=A0A0H3J2K6_CLOPA|nr:ATP-dependent DNA helicase RecG [Clostridium pasteurianum]AJA48161.1 ATP-dependent DNA helicase RecG [Clostridium pasteurianum DSM 525 = ATCC 6013]AJA52149.1 ATP-dependent DNA helicase RecG [Clostridium pasteurianum DSM 525 = ATCC 6013]AOZ75421.1 ATP-dependent DNA helicase RecG [Clostridium pasteurianum DSM 525 = ATCC 6013]AOZ79216.1 ATP-dependent DNA helicase RecG [Clostridium pasteurianum]ELP60687.1 RecG helicase [Clostridium pasteurianum DSM 525 = ATCC 6013]